MLSIQDRWRACGTWVNLPAESGSLARGTVLACVPRNPLGHSFSDTDLKPDGTIARESLGENQTEISVKWRTASGAHVYAVMIFPSATLKVFVRQ